MKYKNLLTQIIIGATLLGFISTAIYVFKEAFSILENGKLPDNISEIDNNALIYILSGLTGLIGGFVAASFGVENKTGTNNKTSKLMNLGSYATNNTSPKKQELFGFIFALSYILIGISSIVIWVILDQNTIQSVSKMATTFFGISIPIVATYLKPEL